ncbi:FecCD family ABC transporter permease [Paracoccus alkanivorans]|uniref:Iron ABC transporter permease n=1 Tax=Paracoccus alkanivorans TaxID=2116655 RepID=A0A3M0MAR9_9RHOB|nr:iron ABC transporter permease [Paracoccus alkanivorans]RMC34405.1 iron ABC transporter permease [Paracoccus alkanivorans]
MTDTGYPSLRIAGRYRLRRAAILLILVAAVAILCLMSVATGTREVGWSDLLAALQGHNDDVGQAAVAMRIPRTLLAAMAGAALGLAGAIMQGVTRNPLADPGILGVNNGAAMAVVIGIAWFQMSSAASYVLVAILGAGLTSVFVYAIGSLGRGGATPLKLALAGAATSVAFSSLTIAVVLPRNDIAGGVRSWQIGGVGGATFDRIEMILPAMLVGFLVAMLSARKLNLLALGDEVAAGLGEKVALARGVAALSAVMLCGAATAVCGPIGFVGLVVPHICRLLFGVDHRWLLPCSALGGAALLILADVTGRLIARPSELDVGIVTAFVGAPFFIWIVRRQRVREL